MGLASFNRMRKIQLPKIEEPAKEEEVKVEEPKIEEAKVEPEVKAKEPVKRGSNRKK